MDIEKNCRIIDVFTVLFEFIAFNPNCSFKDFVQNPAESDNRHLAIDELFLTLKEYAMESADFSWIGRKINDYTVKFDFSEPETDDAICTVFISAVPLENDTDIVFWAENGKLKVKSPYDFIPALQLF
jgi:hypothetical protein